MYPAGERMYPAGDKRPRAQAGVFFHGPGKDSKAQNTADRP
jgi:hypothetical protein